MKTISPLELSSDNTNLLCQNSLTFIVLTSIPIMAALYTSAQKKGNIIQILIWSIICFLILYFPIIDLHYLWRFVNLWPKGFYPSLGGGMPLGSEIEHQNFYNYIYIILSYGSDMLATYSITLFLIKIIQLHKPLNLWLDVFFLVPIINLFLMSVLLIKFFKKKIFIQCVIFLWMFISAVWFYYRYMALIIYMAGIDGYTFIIKWFYNFTEPEGLTYYKDLFFAVDASNMIVPFITYITALINLFVVIAIYKEEKALTDSSPAAALL